MRVRVRRRRRRPRAHHRRAGPRRALRPAPGRRACRTELEDITEVEYRQLRLERVVLVGVWTEGTVEDAENSMAELAALAETAGSEVLDAIYQRRDKPDPATYIGRGKVDGLREIVRATGADTVICDGELAPSQLRNLEDRLKVKVVDRTALILDIFAQHAKSKEGQAQVELAQLNYMKQRLRGWGGNLSRQAGGRAAGGEGIGGRGPGETKIETDRRRINTKIAKLRRELAAHEGHPRHQARGAPAPRRPERRDRRLHQRRQVRRCSTGSPAPACWSRTRCSRPSTRPRATTTGDGRVYTMTDTVGFVRHLPHQLVEAFRSTLEEVADADLILHVVDGSHADPEGQIAAVREVFAEIGAAGPRDHRRQQGGRRRPDGARPAAAREPHASWSQPSTGEGIAEALAADRGASCRGRGWSSRRCCPTTAATWSTGSTSRARSTRWSTPATARSCAAGPTRTWPASWRRTPSEARGDSDGRDSPSGPDRLRPAAGPAAGTSGPPPGPRPPARGDLAVHDRVSPLVERHHLGEQLVAEPTGLARGPVHPQGRRSRRHAPRRRTARGRVHAQCPAPCRSTSSGYAASRDRTSRTVPSGWAHAPRPATSAESCSTAADPAAVVERGEGVGQRGQTVPARPAPPGALAGEEPVSRWVQDDGKVVRGLHQPARAHAGPPHSRTETRSRPAVRATSRCRGSHRPAPRRVPPGEHAERTACRTRLRGLPAAAPGSGASAASSPLHLGPAPRAADRRAPGAPTWAQVSALESSVGRHWTPATASGPKAVTGRLGRPDTSSTMARACPTRTAATRRAAPD